MAQKTKTLEDILKAAAKHRKDFPNSLDYYSIYRTFADFLEKEIHKNVGLVAMRKDGTFLTDHGPEHVATVMRRAADLLGAKIHNYISSYELFILLTAIQVHDAGHIKDGREGHEKAANELLNELKVTQLERRLIYSVARVHGGRVNGSDKDTISQVNITGRVGDHTVHIQFLAALLRFSDELADDHSRASNYLLETSDILGTSKIFHAYASILTVEVRRSENFVSLNYDLTRTMTVEPYEKEQGKDEYDKPIIINQFLLEEIYERTYKMYAENLYCMRFFPADLQIKAIKITINAFDDYTQIYGPVDYVLTERGYPSLAPKSVMEMCEKELTFDNIKLTGAHLKFIIENISISSNPAS
jgi:hypothetical protein